MAGPWADPKTPKEPGSSQTSRPRQDAKLGVDSGAAKSQVLLMVHLVRRRGEALEMEIKPKSGRESDCPATTVGSSVRRPNWTACPRVAASLHVTAGTSAGRASTLDFLAIPRYQ